MRGNGLKSLTKQRDAAAAAVAALETRRADRQDEHAVLGAEVAALGEQIAAADARGEPVAALEAERERRLQRQRDLAAVLPLLEQQLAEARAEMLGATGALEDAEYAQRAEQAAGALARLDARWRPGADYLADAEPVEALLRDLCERAERFVRRHGARHLVNTRTEALLAEVDRRSPGCWHRLLAMLSLARHGAVALPQPAPAPRDEAAPGSLSERLERASRAAVR
jgi:chromosome segregation ATPase